MSHVLRSGICYTIHVAQRTWFPCNAICQFITTVQHSVCMATMLLGRMIKMYFKRPLDPSFTVATLNGCDFQYIKLVSEVGYYDRQLCQWVTECRHEGHWQCCHKLSKRPAGYILSIPYLCELEIHIFHSAVRYTDLISYRQIWFVCLSACSLASTREKGEPIFIKFEDKSGMKRGRSPTVVVLLSATKFSSNII